MTDSSDQEKARKDEERKQAQFEKFSWDIAVFSKRDVADIKGAYNDKREGLK
jgi:hypothetical protein